MFRALLLAAVSEAACPDSPQGSPTRTSGAAHSFPPGPLPPVASDPATRPNSGLARWPWIVGGAVILSALIGTIAVLSGGEVAAGSVTVKEGASRP